MVLSEFQKERKKEYMKEYHRKWYQRNKVRRLQQIKNYRKNKQERVNQWGKDYYQENKEKINARHKEDYRKDKDNVYLRHLKWQKNNPEKVKAHRYALNHNQCEGECVLCSYYRWLNSTYGIEVSKFLGDESNLDFHHTDYENKEGTTLCRMHHMELHNQMGVQA